MDSSILYKPAGGLDLDFNKAFKRAMYADIDIYRQDAMDIDMEMIRLMENNKKYQITIEKLLSKIKKLSHALNYSIKEGGK